VRAQISVLVPVNRRYICRNLPQQSLIQITFSSQIGHSQILIRRAVVGRKSPLSNHGWISSPKRRETAVVSTDRRNTIILTEGDGVLFNEKKV
jgi:hypothetical protein